MGDPLYEDRYSTVYTLEGEIFLDQLTREDDEEYIWMSRTADQLLECERNAVQTMLEGENYL